MSFDCHIWTVFCGYVKAQVYANKPATLEALRINIEQVIADIRVDLYDQFMQKLFRGGH